MNNVGKLRSTTTKNNMVSDDIKYLANKACRVYISSDKIVYLGQIGNFDTHRDLLGIKRVLVC